MPTARTPLAALILFALLTGCIDRPEPHIYILGTGPDPASAGRSDSGLTVIELKPVQIPDHMDTTDFLLRVGDNELRPSPTAIWGERLSIGITRTLASALADRLPFARIIARPSATHPAQRITVEFTLLDIRRSGTCTVEAHWTLSTPGAEQALAPVGAEASVTTVADGPGDAAIAVALTRAIAQIADRIAAGVEPP